MELLAKGINADELTKISMVTAGRARDVASVTEQDADSAVNNYK